MSKGLKVTIQTKPYLKKYLHKLYGNPIHFSANDEFGICFAAFLHRPAENLSVKSHEKKQVLRMRVDKFDSLLDVYLPKSFLTERRGGFHIEDRHIIVINKLFEEKFEADVWRLCTIMNIFGVRQKEALIEAVSCYNIVIDEDITMDALLRKEFRYRKKMELSAPELSAENVKNTLKKIVLHHVRNGKRAS